MAEALVGRWTVGPPFTKEYVKFLKEVGKADLIEMYTGNGIMEVSLEGGNRLLSKNTPQASPQDEYTTVTVIGGKKTEDSFPGLGLLEVECGMEGSKVVSKATHDGQSLIKEMYIEGGKLMNDFKWGNHSFTVVSSKM